MTALCQTAVPSFILEELDPIKDDDQAVKDYGVMLAINMCKKLRDSGIRGFHFYTLNLEKATRLILEGLEFVAPLDIIKPLPWQQVSFVYARIISSPSIRIVRKKMYVQSFGETESKVTF